MLQFNANTYFLANIKTKHTGRRFMFAHAIAMKKAAQGEKFPVAANLHYARTYCTKGGFSK